MRKLNVKRLILFLFILCVIIILCIIGFFFYKLSPVDRASEEIEYKVPLGTSVYDIFTDLEEEGIIRSAFALKIYSKIRGNISIDAGSYTLSKSMSATKIYNILSMDNVVNADEIKITFIEGTTIKDLAKTIEDETDISKEEFLNTINDKEYVKELIGTYWFLTDDILDENIYFALEGYLYPDTYNLNKNVTSKEIIEKLLEGTKNKLDSYKSDIENSPLSIHELMTLASIVEREGYTEDDKKSIAGVLMNRINNGWFLDCDVTSYYALGISYSSGSITENELKQCDNKYNTSSNCYNIGLPIGPISNPSLVAIKAAINPEENQYYYFVSDKYQNIYFSKTYDEHENTIARLQREGLWYE